MLLINVEFSERCSRRRHKTIDILNKSLPTLRRRDNKNRFEAKTVWKACKKTDNTTIDFDKDGEYSGVLTLTMGVAMDEFRTEEGCAVFA